MTQHQLPDPKKFILAGKAIFTVKNEQTQNRFTFKITGVQPKKEGDPFTLFWVKVLTGPDNSNDYTFIGCYTAQKGFWHSGKSRIRPDAQSVKVITWYFKHLMNGTIPEYVKTYHEGRCGRCGRKLTVPESILSGFGPICDSF